MKKKYFYIFSVLLVLSFLLPSIVLAAGSQAPKTFKGVITLIEEYISYLIPLLFGIALVFFLMGVVKYIMYAGNEDKRSEGAKFMFYGIIGLAVMISVWGLVKIITGTFGFPFVIPDLNQIK